MGKRSEIKFELSGGMENLQVEESRAWWESQGNGAFVRVAGSGPVWPPCLMNQQMNELI